MTEITISARNYITKTITKNWVKDPRNNSKSKDALHKICDTKRYYRICEDDGFIRYFALADDEAKVLFAVGGRELESIDQVVKAYLKAGYSLGLKGCIPKEYEEAFIDVSNFF